MRGMEVKLHLLVLRVYMYHIAAWEMYRTGAV